jgi:hypothetical protein
MAVLAGLCEKANKAAEIKACGFNLLKNQAI